MSRVRPFRNDRLRRRWALVFGAGALILAGCGGGGFGGGLEPAGDLDPGAASGFGSDDGMTGDGGGGLEFGPVTATADPGHAVLTVEDGPSIDITADGDGGRFYCILGEEQITIEVSGVDSPSMSLTAMDAGMGLNANLTADSDEDPGRWIQYGGNLQGTIGLDVESGEVSYEGPATRQDREAMSDGDLEMPTVNVTLAINCGLEHSTAEFDGEELTFAPFETDSGWSCLANEEEDVDVDFNYQQPEPRRLNVDVRDDDGLIGHVIVQSDGYEWRAGVSSTEGTDAGLSVDGGTLTYTGTFTKTAESSGSETEVEGTVTVHCPT